ncbi:MAG: hypothetical protein EYC68_12525 [Chloroflexota bacterium]|nr:MAG: hypothetical protein EYC68_12525 [Chloroflexota bacterium]
MPLEKNSLLNDRYEILGLLGQGGMGAVYRGRDRILERLVAVKERAPDPNGTTRGLAQARGQFRREAQTLAQLTHPHLPRIYDYFSAGESEYIVMDLVEGQNLYTFVRQHGAQREALVLSWTRQILDALVYLHSLNLIHRDIKPHNLILTPDDNIVLVDFGLVKLFDPDQPSTLTLLRGVGTPEYAPLEQYSREVGHTDPRTDVYALGATLYTLLTGKPPLDVHARLLNSDAWRGVRDLNPNVSFGTATIIEKAMGLYPPQRYATALDMLQAFGFSPSRFVEPANSAPALVETNPAPASGLLDSRLGAASSKEAPTAPPKGVISTFLAGMADDSSPHGTVAPNTPLSSSATFLEDSSNAPLSDDRTQMLPTKPRLSITLVRGVLRAQIAVGTYVDFVRVPAGKCWIGSDPAADENFQKDELPQREIELGEFWIAKFPLTVAQYTAFTNATNRLTPFDFPQKSEYPITSVSWYDALVFCRWASDNTGKEWRLPTEAEWEKAARGTDGRIYPWGNKFDAARLNSAEGKHSGTTAVDEFSSGLSPYGAWDMVGNVWEWTNDWYKADYYPRASEKNPQGPDTGSYKALRGGAWFSDQFHVRVADRTHINPENRYDYVGFRPVLASGL